MKKKIRCKNCGTYHTLNNVQFGLYQVDFQCPVCKMFNYYKITIKKPFWIKKKEKKQREKNKLLKQQQKLMEKLIMEQNEKIMGKRGWIGIYDKKGNLTIK